jgi:hypothetical protein
MFPIAALLDVGMKVLDKVLPDPAAKAQAQLALMEASQKGELAQLQADMAEQVELTKRLEADMSSDSWLSKNIRPMALISVFAAYFLFAMMSAYGYNANENYVTLLGQWGMLIFSFYFGSRGMEKIAEIWSKKK